MTIRPHSGGNPGSPPPDSSRSGRPSWFSGSLMALLTGRPTAGRLFVQGDPKGIGIASAGHAPNREGCARTAATDYMVIFPEGLAAR